MLDIISGTYDFEDTRLAENFGGHMSIHDIKDLIDEAEDNADIENAERERLEALLGDKPACIATQADALDFAAFLSDLTSAKNLEEKIEVVELYSQMSLLSGKLKKLAEALRREDHDAARAIVHEIYAA
jgi:hypothetical protein